MRNLLMICLIVNDLAGSGIGFDVVFKTTLMMEWMHALLKIIPFARQTHLWDVI